MTFLLGTLAQGRKTRERWLQRSLYEFPELSFHSQAEPLPAGSRYLTMVNPMTAGRTPGTRPYWTEVSIHHPGPEQGTLCCHGKSHWALMCIEDWEQTGSKECILEFCLFFPLQTNSFVLDFTWSSREQWGDFSPSTPHSDVDVFTKISRKI